MILNPLENYFQKYIQSWVVDTGFFLNKKLKLNSHLATIDDSRRKMELEKKDLYAWSRAYVRDERKNLVEYSVVQSGTVWRWISRESRNHFFFNATDWFFCSISFAFIVSLYTFYPFFLFNNIKRNKNFELLIYISFFVYLRLFEF